MLRNGRSARLWSANFAPRRARDRAALHRYRLRQRRARRVACQHPKSSSVSLRKIAVARYRQSDFVVTGGIAPQDLIVTEGGKFLKEGQTVAWEGK